jgi:hypothetical protein
MKTNYAGIHVLVLWGCGTECIAGAAVNGLTGRVVFLPEGAFSLCFDVRPDSRLITIG